MGKLCGMIVLINGIRYRKKKKLLVGYYIPEMYQT